MSQPPIDAIGGAKKVGGAGGEQVGEDLKPGELVVEETAEGDVEGTFKGDGKTTAQNIVGRFLQINAGNDPDLEGFKGSENAAQFGAEMAIRGNPNNRKLLTDGQTADKPVPHGELFTVSQSDLKKALAPFKGKLDQLRSAVAGMQTTGEMTSGQSKTIGKSFTPALGLPTDPKI